MSPEELPSGENDQVVVNTLNLVRLCACLFDMYREEHELSHEQAAQVDSMTFLLWYGSRSAMITSEQALELCEKANSPVETRDMLDHLVHDPMGANTLAGIWPQIVLAFRGVPSSILESVHQIVLLKWADGRVAPLSSFVPRELAAEDMVYTDGVLCTLIQATAHSLAKASGDIGLDMIHNDRSQWAPDHAYEVLMGLLLKILQGATIIDAQSGNQVKLDPKMVAPCQNVMRVLQSLFRPPIPPGVIAKIKQRRKAAGLETVGEGGWDQE